MAATNFERMIQLVEEVFDVRNDPEQLDVNEEIIARLKMIHEATVSEYDEGDGPIAWLLLIPTTTELMNKFIASQISEKELFNLTPLNATYDAVYLCSASVLKEYRRKGITKRLALAAIEKIRNNHPIKSLFSWAFSKEGDLGAEELSRITSLPLFKRK